MAKVVSVDYVCFLMEGTGAYVCWVRLNLVFLVGRTVSGGVFWGACDLTVILGSLSPDGCGCVPVLLVVWHRVSSTVACWSLSGAGS